MKYDFLIQFDRSEDGDYLLPNLIKRRDERLKHYIDANSNLNYSIEATSIIIEKEKDKNQKDQYIKELKKMKWFVELHESWAKELNEYCDNKIKEITEIRQSLGFE